MIKYADALMAIDDDAGMIEGAMFHEGPANIGWAAQWLRMKNKMIVIMLMHKITSSPTNLFSNLLMK